MISFAAPWVLGGLAATAIPLILHLVARREPPVQSFPAVRYLEDTARRHQRRFKLQHWLLLAVRMALIAALVLAAAGPSRAGRGPAGHAPAALVLIVDNSLSSAAIQDGVPVLESLRTAAIGVLARAGPGDQLWLITTEGKPVRGDAASLRAELDLLAPQPWRLDLGAAIGTAEALLAASPLPGEVVVLSDLQASAVTTASSPHLLVGVPEGSPPANLGLAAIETGPQPWTSGGRVTVSATGATNREAPATIHVAGRPARQLLIRGGGSGTATMTDLAPGWHLVTAELAPDELRLDDAATAAVRVSPPIGADCRRDDSHLAAACQVLVENGRIVPGTEVAVDRLAPGPSIIMPPEDPAALGALNRSLMARGAGWQFGELRTGPMLTDSSAILVGHELRRRYQLESTTAAPAGVLLTADGEPWLVRSGELVLLGSRLDPSWTSLPLSAAFMPFMDLLLNRLARGEVARIGTAPGMTVTLPDRVTGIASGAGVERVEGGAGWAATQGGLHWLLASEDTIGVLEVNPDPRESVLDRADPGAVASIWPGARLETPERVAQLAFTVTARADLRAPLLWLAAALGLAELFLAGFGRRNP